MLAKISSNSSRQPYCKERKSIVSLIGRSSRRQLTFLAHRQRRNYTKMVVSGPPQSPRTGLALTDLQSTSASVDSSNSGGGSCSIGGGLISGLAISSNGSGNWSTRGVGGIGAGLGLSCSSASSPAVGGLFGGKMGDGHSSGPQFQGPFGGFPSSGNGGVGLFNNCGCSSSDYGLFKK